ncbi:MAG: nitroreductase family protein [Desulfobacterales bacterium]|nr:nitroreductase family protein [Desulfobacterales bacterium]
MEILEAIHTRRSIRKYQDKEIPDEMIRTMLSAAMMAPSAGDERAWQFVVVTDQDKKEQITAVHPYVSMIAKAPLGILVCGDLTKEKYEGYWPQDCSAAMQNLLLAAHGIGLGAVWTGIYPMAERMEKFVSIFGLPDRIIPFGLAVVGWPAQSIPSKERFTQECVHYNKW